MRLVRRRWLPTLVGLLLLAGVSSAGATHNGSTKVKRKATHKTIFDMMSSYYGNEEASVVLLDSFGRVTPTDHGKKMTVTSRHEDHDGMTIRTYFGNGAKPTTDVLRYGLVADELRKQGETVIIVKQKELGNRILRWGIVDVRDNYVRRRQEESERWNHKISR